MKHGLLIENERLELQVVLDSGKTQAERNKMGQFATPGDLATQILEYAKRVIDIDNGVRFLDPAIGTGAFYSAFVRVFGRHAKNHAHGFEVDEHYGKVARELWKNYPLYIRMEDFTSAIPPCDDKDKADLVICNPPYVRHHHLSLLKKQHLQRLVASRYRIKISGLSGLYCYFLCLSKEWMAKGALGGWLIPSEFMDVNYGEALKEFLLDRVTLLHVHRFNPDDLQFDDALVSSAVVWFKNELCPQDHEVCFSYGGALSNPDVQRNYSVKVLRNIKKWTSLPLVEETYAKKEPTFKLGDFFYIKRGVATGANDYFVMTADEAASRSIPEDFLTPILPSPRFVKTDIIESDSAGLPVGITRHFLFSSDIPEDQIRLDYPHVWDFLRSGHDRGIPERYICRNRSPWYSQERREASPFLCTYMGRTGVDGLKPFRFILNQSKAIAANVYLMLYPKPFLMRLMEGDKALVRRLWEALSNIPAETLLCEGRVYGGGLYKIEPKELLNASADSVVDIIPDAATPGFVQVEMFV
ncbi:MAG: SAM-dependent DNA methyltransferase [Nitrospirae bacterium]|nr:SAM-dependent DNA methyltransferase [Nitrospirota bacterium]